MYVIGGQRVFVAQRETSPQLPEVKIVLPEELKKWLVDDWDFVTRQKQVKSGKLMSQRTIFWAQLIFA